VVVVVGVGDVRAAAVLDLDLKAVADVPGVVDGVEVVDAAVGDAGLDAWRQNEDCQCEKAEREALEKAGCVHWRIPPHARISDTLSFGNECGNFMPDVKRHAEFC
jgi:hypothetical protein